VCVCVCVCVSVVEVICRWVCLGGQPVMYDRHTCLVTYIIGWVVLS